jgi:hypothetical protein
MTDWAQEIMTPQGVLRIERQGMEMDEAGKVTAFLNGEEIIKDRALELLAEARRALEGSALWALTCVPPG